jgi:hypothetical protein
MPVFIQGSDKNFTPYFSLLLLGQGSDVVRFIKLFEPSHDLSEVSPVLFEAIQGLPEETHVVNDPTGVFSGESMVWKVESFALPPQAREVLHEKFAGDLSYYCSGVSRCIASETAETMREAERLQVWTRMDLQSRGPDGLEPPVMVADATSPVSMGGESEFTLPRFTSILLPSDDGVLGATTSPEPLTLAATVPLSAGLASSSPMPFGAFRHLYVTNAETGFIKHVHPHETGPIDPSPYPVSELRTDPEPNLGHHGLESIILGTSGSSFPIYIKREGERFASYPASILTSSDGEQILDLNMVAYQPGSVTKPFYDELLERRIQPPDEVRWVNDPEGLILGAREPALWRVESHRADPSLASPYGQTHDRLQVWHRLHLEAQGPDEAAPLHVADQSSLGDATQPPAELASIASPQQLAAPEPAGATGAA